MKEENGTNSEEDFLLLKKRERRIAMDIDKEGVPL
jgi:hypothetical protein